MKRTCTKCNKRIKAEEQWLGLAPGFLCKPCLAIITAPASTIDTSKELDRLRAKAAKKEKAA